MQNLPNGGKVVIVDDCFHEVLPLINILNKDRIPVMYFTGNKKELPPKKLQGVRVFFLDLRFSPSVDPKTIVSNACNILKNILENDNGPYLLIIWSSTGDEYKSDLEEALKDKPYKPEFILCLSKADYFQTKDSNIFTLKPVIKNVLLDRCVDNADEITENIIAEIIATEDETIKEFITESIEKLREELYGGLKNAGLLSLFIIWENTIRDSSHKVVNEVFSQIPESIPPDKKLPAMAYYLAKNRLDKQFEKVDEGDKLGAALMELNDLYAYFYSKDVTDISVDGFLPLNIQKNTELVPSQAKFNSWKMIFPTSKKDMPGNIYKDEQGIFEFFDLIKYYGDSEKYTEAIMSLKEDSRIKYVCVNINGECETAHNKYPVIRVIPGILIPCDVYEEYEKNNVLKALGKAKDYIFNEFDPIEYEDVEYLLIFNINQNTFLHKDKLKSMEVYFTLHRKYYLKLRQSLAADYSKQGLDLYSE